MRNKKLVTCVLAMGGAALGWTSPASADIAVIFNTNPTLAGTVVPTSPTTATLDLDDTVMSRVEVLLQEVGGPILGIVDISNYNADGLIFDFNMHFDLTRSHSGTWSADGTFSLTDTDTGTPAIHGAFNGRSVQMVAGSTTLEIEGTLSGDPLLENRPYGGPDWTYDGEGSSLTVRRSRSFNGGSVFALQFNTGASSLDDLFGSPGAFSGGKVEGTVVPVPAAAMLAMMGMGMVSRVRRRKN